MIVTLAVVSFLAVIVIILLGIYLVSTILKTAFTQCVLHAQWI